jgi:glycogen synthase
MNIYSATPLPPNYHDLGAYNNGSEEDRENAKDEYGLSPMRAVQRRYGKYVRKFVIFFTSFFIFHNFNICDKANS